MMDSETIRFIREEIKKQVNIILSGLSGNNDQFNEDISSFYPGSPTITQRPVMHPYGLVSRAPASTVQVVARVGDHPGNKMVLGHRDANRPTISQGETQLYNQFGQAIYLQDGNVRIGTASSSNPVPTGNELLDFIRAFFVEFKAHQHIGNLGALTLPDPSTETNTDNLQADWIDNNKIVSDYVFVDKGS